MRVSAASGPSILLLLATVCCLSVLFAVYKSRKYNRQAKLTNRKRELVEQNPPPLPLLVEEELI